MKIVVWSGMPVLAHMGMRVHYLLPATLGKLGHEVYYCPGTWGTGIPSVPDYIKNEVLPYLKVVSPDEFYDIFPADVFIYAFTIPFKEEEVERKLLERLPFLKNMVSCLVYYCLDYWEGWIRNFPVEEWESKIIEHSTHIFAVSPQLCLYLSRRYKREVFLLPNAIPPWFKPLHMEKERRQEIALIVGSAYLRKVDEVFALAKSFPSWDFYWVAGFDQSKGLIGHSPLGNLFLLKEKFPHEVSAIARVSLVGLVPAGRNWCSYFGDPTKWYIYHGCGLPVVSRGVLHHANTSFYPFTFVCKNLKIGFEKFLSSLSDINYPITPLPIHTYEHRASTLIKILSGEEQMGYGKSDLNTASWSEVWYEKGK